MVAESSSAVLALLKQVSDTPDVNLLTRLRLAAALYEPAPPRALRQNGRPRQKGARRPTWPHLLKDALTQWTPLTVSTWSGGGTRDVEICTDTAVWYHTGLPPGGLRGVLMRDPQDEVEPQARLSPRLAHQPAQIWDWVVRRWTLEVTFAEARAHLGMETQRQWNALAIQRTPPALVGLSSLVPLLAHGLLQAEARVVRPAAWSAKVRPTFSAARAVVRRELWSCGHFAMSESHAEMVKIPRSVLDRLTDTVCYAA